MRTLYIVTYDICDEKRLRQVFKLMRGYGDHLQYSVFRCELSDRERVELISRLTDLIKPSEDQALLFPAPPVGSETARPLGRLALPASRTSGRGRLTDAPQGRAP